MTQEDKELLLKDIYARLPYGVCYEHFTWDDECGEDCVAAQIYSINTDGYVKNCYDDETVYIDNVRPYLFPLSSMTEEQRKKLKELGASVNSYNRICFDSYDEYGIDIVITVDMTNDVFDWLNKYHFDYRGLIPKGLAINATGLNIY